MAPPRVPLQEISENVRRRKELTPYKRAEIIGAAKCGVKTLQIGMQLSYSRRTVRTTITRPQPCNNGKSQPRSGRPKLLDRYEEQVILRVVHQFPKFTYKQIRIFTGLKYCNKNNSKSFARAPHHLMACKRTPKPDQGSCKGLLSMVQAKT
jgi:transposase